MTDDEIKAARHRATELHGFDRFDPPSSRDTDEVADLLITALDDIERLKNTLRIGEVERDALRTEVERMRPVYEAASPCPFTSGDGWLMCQLKTGHGGSCQMKDVSVTKAKAGEPSVVTTR